MVDYGSILVTVLDNFKRLLPVRTVDEWQQGIKVYAGRVRPHRDFLFRKGEEDLGSGIYGYIPFIGKMIIEDTADNVVDTERQDLTTGDGRNVVIKASVIYRISSTADYYRNLRDQENSILNVAEIAIASHVCQTGYETLRTSQQRGEKKQQTELEKILLEEIRRRSARYGIDVKSIGFTHFSAAPSLRLIMNDLSTVNGE